MSFRVLILAVAVVACWSTTAAASRAPAPLDVEIAIDTTGSTGPSIRRLQRDAEQIVKTIKRASPGARVALVQFKDNGDTPEYEVMQSLTGDPQAVDIAAAKLGPGGGGDNPEAYNVVFRNSYADKAIGWRSGSRKVVVVIGDAEPHGAGAAGFDGCIDASVDPHALRTRQELIGMKSNERTLVMIRQAGTATVALRCYESLVAAGYRGGSAVDSGTDLAGAVASTVGRAASIKITQVQQTTQSKHPTTTTTTRSGGAGGGGADRTAPHVVALKSGGTRGANIRLIYRVTDGSGRPSERVTVYAGSRVLSKSGWAPFGPANGKAYYFDFPSSSSMSGTYTFCVESRDPSGNISKASCAQLVLF